MKKLKSSLTNMLVVLTVIAIVAAGVLASVNAVTAPQIEKINAENLAAGIKAVMGSEDIQVSEPWEVDAFTAYDIRMHKAKILARQLSRQRMALVVRSRCWLVSAPRDKSLATLCLSMPKLQALVLRLGSGSKIRLLACIPARTTSP